MNIYEKFGLRSIINGSGKMTVLGASAVHSDIAQALSAAAMDYVDIYELMIAAGKKIAQVTGAEDGCPTSGAAPGIAIATAAVIVGENLSLIEKVPNTDGLKNEIILQKGHAVHFGASISQMIALGGGKVIEVGQANHAEKDHILNAISEKTAALFYVKSHHAVQKGMQSLKTMIAIAQEKKIPMIVDAAAEEDFRYYIAQGADLVIYSGGKALEGPTSGLICGKKDLIAACHKQYKGIGRAMKVGKEAMIGLMTALDRYDSKEEDAKGQIERMQWLINQFANVPGIAGAIVQDEAGRAIYRGQLTINENIVGINAAILIQKLETGHPAIYTRNYYANMGIITIDPRPLLAGQEKIIAKRILEIINEYQGKEEHL